MTHKEALQNIAEISYTGHPEGRAARLEMIFRYANNALQTPQVECTSPCIDNHCPVHGITAKAKEAGNADLHR